MRRAARCGILRMSVATPGYQRRGAQLGDRVPATCDGELHERVIRGNARVVDSGDGPGPFSRYRGMRSD